MKQFNVTVNGVTYDVVVEEVKQGSSAAQTVVSAPVASKPAAAAKPSAPKPSAPKPAAGAGSVSAPMPGTIIDVKVQAGTTVKAGDILCILEAMKMENEILAPSAGVIASVSVSKGVTVATGDVLVSYE